jgi:hypothetical protein
VIHTVPTKTRCVIHNGPAINLISTIDIYDKLVLAEGKVNKRKKNVHHVIKEKNNIYIYFIFLHHINYEEPKRDLTLNDEML